MRLIALHRRIWPEAVVCAAVAVLTSWADAAPALPAKPDDPVAFTFAVTGDSRQDPHAVGLSPQQRIWMQDTPALSRIVREIQARKPQALFFTGDMIMGSSTNFARTERQYAYWRGLMSVLPQTGTYVVPVPGNHEMQIKVPRAGGGKPRNILLPACENLWRENMGDWILNTNLWRRLVGQPVQAWDIYNAPRIGGADLVQSDQRRLTFSFDCDKIHFAVINTSAVGNPTHAPVHWLSRDLAAAKRRGDQHFFVFGHIPAFTYYVDGSRAAHGLDKYPADAEAFWNVIQHYGATYFCGHEHVYHAMQPRGSGSWQVICGAAGAPFEAKPGQSRNPNDRDFAWVLVKVHASGRVFMDAYGFNDHFGRTHRLQRVELDRGQREPKRGSSGHPVN